MLQNFSGLRRGDTVFLMNSGILSARKHESQRSERCQQSSPERAADRAADHRGLVRRAAGAGTGARPVAARFRRFAGDCCHGNRRCRRSGTDGRGFCG